MCRSRIFFTRTLTHIYETHASGSAMGKVHAGFCKAITSLKPTTTTDMLLASVPPPGPRAVITSFKLDETYTYRAMPVASRILVPTLTTVEFSGFPPGTAALNIPAMSLPFGMIWGVSVRVTKPYVRQVLPRKEKTEDDYGGVSETKEGPGSDVVETTAETTTDCPDFCVSFMKTTGQRKTARTPASRVADVVSGGMCCDHDTSDPAFREIESTTGHTLEFRMFPASMIVSAVIEFFGPAPPAFTVVYHGANTVESLDAVNALRKGERAQLGFPPIHPKERLKLASTAVLDAEKAK